MTTTTLKAGDLVIVVGDPSHIIREEAIHPRGVIVNQIGDSDWHRVHLTWLDKNKIVDLPTKFLRKVG